MSDKKKAAAPAARKITSIRLDPDLHRRARLHAVEAGTTLQAVVNEALEDYLKKRGA